MCRISNRHFKPISSPPLLPLIIQLPCIRRKVKIENRRNKQACKHHTADNDACPTTHVSKEEVSNGKRSSSHHQRVQCFFVERLHIEFAPEKLVADSVVNGIGKQLSKCRTNDVIFFDYKALSILHPSATAFLPTTIPIRLACPFGNNGSIFKVRRPLKY